MGADNGLTRYEEAPQHEADRVMFFPAERNLADNCVKALYVPDENREEIWALTQTAVAHIILRTLSGEEKAEILTEETLSYVDRHGMVSQKDLTEPRKPASAVPHGHSDNSGTFTGVSPWESFANTHTTNAPSARRTRKPYARGQAPYAARKRPCF